MILQKNSYKLSITTTITILAIVSLSLLGCWQVYKAYEQNELMNFTVANLSTPPIKLTKEHNLEDLEYRKVKVQGYYQHDKETFVYEIDENGNEGFLLFTPIRTVNNRLIMVNRGWIPIAFKSPPKRIDTLEPGLVEVVGILMASEKKAMLSPKNNSDKNIWYARDLEQMQEFVGEKLEQFYISIFECHDDYNLRLKNDINMILSSSNEHLEYAITWFLAAIILLTIYIIYHRNSLKKQK